MKITCLASSSHGNCYLVETNSNTKLLIEAGLSYSTIRKALLKHGVLIPQINGCIISHKHQDHAKGASDIARHIQTYCNLSTLVAAGNAEIKEIKAFEPIKVKDMTITAFPVEHDVPTFGFIIETPDEALLYINDAKFVEWDLSAIPFTHVMIEANYNDDLLDTLNPNNYRTMNSHMALSTTLQTLKHLNLTRCKEIFLMHLSDLNSNEQWMLRKILAETGITTFVCNKFGGTKTNPKGM